LSNETELIYISQSRKIKHLLIPTHSMNCLIVDDDNLSRTFFEDMVKQSDQFTGIKNCSSSLEAMNILKKEDIDVLFLDVEMPKMSGIEMLKALEWVPQVILTTSHQKYAIDAFELNVLDYLVKPITLPRLMKALAKVKDPADSKDQVSAEQEYVFIKKNFMLIKVPVKDILWIEAAGDYITIHTKAEQFLLHATLKSLEAKLHVNKFARVHRSYMVQLDNVNKVEGNTIYINDTSIPIGAFYRENFIGRITTFQ